MSEKMTKKTNLYLIDEKLWAWAKYRASLLGLRSVSELVFQLIAKEKERLESAD